MRNNEASAQKILIVGASSDLREIGTSLVSDGFQIRFSNTSEAALTASQAWYPDFVIVDDTASGFIKAFRALNFRTPLLARTPTRAGFAGLLDDGADDCVERLCSVTELRARIRSKLKYSRRPVKLTRQES